MDSVLSRQRLTATQGLLATAVLLVAGGCRKPVVLSPDDGVQTSVASSASATAALPLVLEDGFTVLTLPEFEAFAGAADTWREEAGVIVCSGMPKGYVYCVRPFRNFTLRCDYRFAEPAADADPAKSALANTGFMIHIQEPHKVWPRSLEVQGRWDQMCSIKSNGGVPDLVIQDDPAAREAARKPVGQWNSVEIVSRDGALTALLNGQKICESEAGELTEGSIGLQSELFEVRFRNLRIREE